MDGVRPLDPGGRLRLVTYSIDGEHEVTARVAVSLEDEDVRATCLLRAFAEDHTVVGELSFTPEHGADQPLEETVRTERRATSLELVGCTAPGQPGPAEAPAASRRGVGRRRTRRAQLLVGRSAWSPNLLNSAF